MNPAGRILSWFGFGPLVAGMIVLAGPSVADAALIKVNAGGNDLRGVVLETSELGARDVTGVEYPVLGGQTRRVSGWSLQRVLAVAADNPDAEGWLEPSTLPSVSLAPPSSNVGARISVTANEIVDQGIFGGGRTPVLEENPDGSIDFIKPGVGGAPGVAYRYTVSVEIRVEGEAPDAKRLRLEISPRAVEPGGRVSFRATLPGQSDSGLTFAWTIRETRTGRTITKSTRGGSLSRTFSREGSYRVLVSLGEDAEFGPASGAFSVGRPSGDGGSGGQGGAPGAEPAGGPGTFGPAPSTPGAGGSGGGLSTGGAGGAGSPATALPESTPADRPTPSDEGLEEVSGLLIDPSVEAGPSPSDRPAEADQAGDGFGLSGEAATLFGVGLLIALGGLIEARLLFRRS